MSHYFEPVVIGALACIIYLLYRANCMLDTHKRYLEAIVWRLDNATRREANLPPAPSEGKEKET